jgi:hypothetical protein
MPMTVTATTGGTGYASPFVGPANHTHHIKVDISGLTVNEVDADGYLKPAVPLRYAGGLGVLVSAPAQAVDGVTVEAVKLPLATVPPTNGTLAAETGDCFVAVATHCAVNRDIAEDVLGRAYSADEVAALAAAFISLTST